MDFCLSHPGTILEAKWSVIPSFPRDLELPMLEHHKELEYIQVVKAPDFSR